MSLTCSAFSQPCLALHQTDLTFSPEYAAAIESKQVAQQDAERAKFVVEKVCARMYTLARIYSRLVFFTFCVRVLVAQAAQDAKSVVIKAQGEAESAMLIGNALAKNPGFLELRRLETARHVSATMAGSQNKLYLDASSLLLNIADTDGGSAR